MPSRSTILTGQHPTTHGVWMNGVPLPVDAPSVADVLHDAGYRTALVGKAHFEPFLDPFLRFAENAARPHGHDAAAAARTAASSTSSSPPTAPMGPLHYARWLQAEHPEAVGGFYAVLDARPAGERGRRRRHRRAAGEGQPDRRGSWYHTDWVADRTIAWLDSLDADDDWFCWMSFPDPHHPWDPPESEVGRVDWRDVPLPAGYPESAAEREAHPRRQAAPLAALVRRHARVELRGAGRVGAGDADRRPGARGQRPQRRRVRADRRGARPGAGARSRRGAGATTSTSSSPPTTASCRATSACCSRARTTSTG